MGRRHRRNLRRRPDLLRRLIRLAYRLHGARNLEHAVVSADETDPLTGPSGYDNFNVVDSSLLGGSGPCIMGNAYKHSSASSDDPGAFGGTFTGWQASTIAVRPVAAGPGGAQFMTTNRGYW